MDIDTYLKRKAEIREADGVLMSEVEKIDPVTFLKPLFRPILECDDVKTLYWNQYTPYFNDGDACVFGISDIHVELKSHRDEYEDAEECDHPEEWPWIGQFVSEYGYGGKKNPDYNAEISVAAAPLLDAWNGLSDYLEETFGDGYDVRVSLQDGEIEIEHGEYHHD